MLSHPDPDNHVPQTYDWCWIIFITLDFARFKGMWSISYTNGYKDMYAITIDGRISVKSQSGRLTSKLKPSDEERTFPSSDGWFKAEQTIRPDTWEFIRLKDDDTLEIQHFCSAKCTKAYRTYTRDKYCCVGRGTKGVRGM